MDLILPKEITIVDTTNKERVFILSKFPTIQGREIIAKYPLSAMPKIGDYEVSEETMLKLMAFVGVEIGDVSVGSKIQTLNSRVLVNNHVEDWEMLAKLEVAMIEYNCSFFRNGRIFDFLQDFALKSLPKILKTWMDLLAQSSPTEKQP